MPKRFSLTAILNFFAAIILSAQGNLILIGGGSEKDWNGSSWSDKVYRKIVQLADNRRIIILSANAETNWMKDYFRKLGANYAENLQVENKQKANSKEIYERLVACDAIFIKGGNQAAYFLNWQDSLLLQAIREVYLRGGVIAGTSAGAMILSEFIFSAEKDSISSLTALQSPFSDQITIRRNFLPLLKAAIVDTHFTQRGRLGRLATFLANIKSNFQFNPLGIGIDDNTAILVDAQRYAEVYGEGAVSFLKSSKSSQLKIIAERPLHFTDIELISLTEGFRIDLESLEVIKIPAYAQTNFQIKPRKPLEIVGFLINSTENFPEKIGAFYISNYQEDNALYLGKLKVEPGNELVSASIVLNAPFGNQDWSENLLGGAQLILCAKPGCWVTGIEGGMRVIFTHPSRLLNSLQNSFPLMIIDGKKIEIVAHSQYVTSPEKSLLPRQSVALKGCLLHFIAPGYFFNFLNGEITPDDTIYALVGR